MCGEGRGGGGGWGYCVWDAVASNIKETESIVAVASGRVLETHYPTMSTIWGHVDRQKRNK